jgi:acyl dehydratase
MVDRGWSAVIGLTVATPARTLSRGETGVLNSLLWTRGAIHTDAGAARAAGLPDLSVAGPVAAAVASGLWVSSDLMPALERDHGIRLLAILESRVRYLHPVLVGDTVRLRVTLESARPSRRNRARAVLALAGDLVSQRGECVLKIEERILAERGGPTPKAPAPPRA